MENQPTTMIESTSRGNPKPALVSPEKEHRSRKGVATEEQEGGLCAKVQPTVRLLGNGKEAPGHELAAAASGRKRPGDSNSGNPTKASKVLQDGSPSAHGELQSATAPGSQRTFLAKRGLLSKDQDDYLRKVIKGNTQNPETEDRKTTGWCLSQILSAPNMEGGGVLTKQQLIARLQSEFGRNSDDVESGRYDHLLDAKGFGDWSAMKILTNHQLVARRNGGASHGHEFWLTPAGWTFSDKLFHREGPAPTPKGGLHSFFAASKKS